MILSLVCLALSLFVSLKKGSPDNLLSVPGGVTWDVTFAQFLGLLVGVLMEDEIPQGLQQIANGLGHKFQLNGSETVHKRLVITSIVRLAVGYLFFARWVAEL